MSLTAHRRNAIQPFSQNMIIRLDNERNIGRTGWLDIVQAILRQMSCIGGTLVENEPATQTITRKQTMIIGNHTPQVRLSEHIDYVSEPIDYVSKHTNHCATDPTTDTTDPTTDTTDPMDAMDGSDYDSDGDVQLALRNTYTKPSPVYGLHGRIIR
jgi:hypothetical protein